MLFTLVINSPVPAIYGLLSIALILLSLSLHEFAHAYSATLLGDPTPRIGGRVTLNPLSHLDPVGTIFILVGYFGWGKPVQINPYNFRDPRRDSAIVSISGPLTNFAFAIAMIAFLKIVSLTVTGVELVYLQYSFTIVILVSFMLGIFNLLPIAPLDGEKILMYFLPLSIRSTLEPLMQKFGLIVLILIILPILPGGHSVLSYLFAPLQKLIFSLVEILV